MIYRVYFTNICGVVDFNYKTYKQAYKHYMRLVSEETHNTAVELASIQPLNDGCGTYEKNIIKFYPMEK
jgi:hypothetical protein